MKKWLVWLGLMLFCSVQIYAQLIKDADFNQKVFSAGFDEEDKNLWPAQNSQHYFLLVQNSRYQIECKSAEKKAYLLPKGAPQQQHFKAEANITIDKKTAKESTGAIGLAISIENKLAGGYLFEINAEKQYRVTEIAGSGNYNYLTGNKKKEGWVNSKEINNPGKNNKLTVYQNTDRIKFMINGEQVYLLRVDSVTIGQNGILVNGLMKASANDFSIYTPQKKSFDATGKDETEVKKNDVAVEKENTDATKNNINNTRENAESEDFTTLNEALLKCRVESQKLTDKNENLDLQLNEARKKQEELQKFIAENLDVKLKGELDLQKKKNEELKKQVETLSAENKDLKVFKKDIEKNKDGDIVIVLSEQLKKEREKVELLEQKIKKLEQEQSKPKKGK